MNKFIKYIVCVALVGFIASGCNQTDLDLRVSPNDLAADASDPNLLLNSIQLAYAGNQNVLSDITGELTRIEYFFGRDYFNNLPGNTLNGVWSRTYSSATTEIGDSDANVVAVGILTNLQALEAQNAVEGGPDLTFHISLARTLYAHSLMQMVDMIGVAANSQAGRAEEFPAPLLDSGQDVYNAALALLDEAETGFASEPSAVGVQDFFYGGNSAQWIRLINTIRMRTFVLTGNSAGFDAIVSGGEFISTAADDFQLNYGTSELQPDDRHPDFADDYKSDGADNYQSNWLMNLMFQNLDPRRNYYFYRQNPGTPGGIDVMGVEVDPNEEQLACSLVVPPPHYDGLLYCSADNGFWGRSHGNDEGIPPDGFQRTAAGLYPAGGRYDDASFGNVGFGQGAAGAGIEPIFLSSYVDFWQGIMASGGERSGFLRSGLEKSIAKVQSFQSLDGSSDFSNAPTADDVTAYIDGIVEAFDAASGDDAENIFAEQYFTTLYGAGTEAYNYYRLTGFPTTVLPNWEPNPGPFPRTLLIPQNEVINNPNVEQRLDLTTQVFWDTNPPSPAFPPAN